MVDALFNEPNYLAAVDFDSSRRTKFSSWRIHDAGHNMNTFKSQIPDVLAWIGAHTAGPAPTGRQLETTGGVLPWPLPRSGAHGALADTDQ